MARKEFETLIPQMFCILMTLKEPRHGYDIMKEISIMTQDEMKPEAL